MDGEITLNRSVGTVMKLDDNEQALMDEIEIDMPRPRCARRIPKPAVYRPPQSSAPPPSTMQEDIDAFAHPTKQSAPPQHQEDPVDYGEYEEEDDEQPQYMQGDYAMQEEERPSPGYKTIDEEKADLVNKLGRLEKKGFTVNKRLNAYSPVDELRTEVKRITYSIEVDKSVKFSRRMLIACVTGLEFLNKRYNPFDVQLDGWSENVMESVDDYDEVFEELYVKYRTKMKMAPEVKLIMMLGGSAMMFHLTNSMFKSVMPNMNDVMKQNPDLIKSMMSAVQNTTRSPQEPSVDAPVGGTGQYEMKGPGLDISSLMGGISMPPPPPMNTTMGARPIEQEDEDEDVSDIISISGDSTGGELRQVNVDSSKPKRTRRKKKTEINL